MNANINVIISIFYEKLNAYKTIKDLTFFIGNTGVDLKDGKENRQDIDITAFSYNDAKYIRKQMQINNEELYYLSMYINVFAESEKELEYFLSRIEGILSSIGISSRRANFRQEQIFISCLPLMKNETEIRNISRRNVLTSGLVSTYPFISNAIFDINGIIYGTNQFTSSIIMIDKFDKDKYKNANICILGTSGSGKSFFAKIMMLRYRILGIDQYVIDPEREYVNICESVQGLLIKIGPTSNTFINVLDIREEQIEDSTGYLQLKLSRLKGFFKLSLGHLNEEEWAVLESCIIKAYGLKGVTFDDQSLYRIIQGKKIFKKSDDMPVLEDVYNELIKLNQTESLSSRLRPFIKGSLSYFNKHTNISLNNKFIVGDVYDLGEENIKYGMYIFAELFWDKIKKDRNINKTIYMDEIWRLVGITSNIEVASFVYKIFKTIRKYSGSGCAITQDVSDLFSLDNGNFGKSILNNSNIKCFFALEEENIIDLERFIKLSENEKVEIKGLKRGEALMHVGNNHMLVKIECSDEEKELL